MPPTYYSVIRTADRASTTLVPGGPSLLEHRSVRGPLGILLGVLVGVGCTWLADALDRRLRTAARTSEVFALPVVAEIPGEPEAWHRGPAPPPVVDVVVNPLSSTAEAYRRLHVSVRLAPLVLWIRSGVPSNGAPDGREPTSPLLPGQASAGEPEDAGRPVAPASPGDPSSAAVGGDPLATLVAGAPGPLVPVEDDERPRRRVVLVTSPTDEPTRSLVVANLAAVLAESGQRVLVATTGGLRTRLEMDDRPGLPVSPLGPDPSPEAIVANARPSQLPGVSSLALGRIIDNPSKLALKSSSIVRAALALVDVLIFEAPLLSTQDAEALLPVTDVAVVVAESWRTTVADGVRSRQLLARHRAPVLGVALTSASDGRRWRRPWRRDDDRSLPSAAPSGGGTWPPDGPGGTTGRPPPAPPAPSRADPRSGQAVTVVVPETAPTPIYEPDPASGSPSANQSPAGAPVSASAEEWARPAEPLVPPGGDAAGGVDPPVPPPTGPFRVPRPVRSVPTPEVVRWSAEPTSQLPAAVAGQPLDGPTTAGARAPELAAHDAGGDEGGRRRRRRKVVPQVSPTSGAPEQAGRSGPEPTHSPTSRR